MACETTELSRYVAELAFEHIPERALDRLRLSILDSLGAAVYGFDMPWTRIQREMMLAKGGQPAALVWNTSQRLPVAEAAFLNSVATHAFELDDRRIASYMHPASAAVPAALATSEAITSITGREFLTAITAGYEVGLRIGKCVSPGAFERGFYPPGIGGAFTAAITAAKLRHLEPVAIAYVLNLVATQAAGLYSPTAVKRFNLGRGTYNGLLAVELVMAGFSGVDDVLEREVGGFCTAYADSPDLKLLVDGIGVDYEINKVEHKPYVSSRPNHSAIDSTLELRRRHPDVRLDDIRAVEIEIGTVNYRYGAGFPVVDVPSALMSVAYCATVAFLDGDAFLSQFTEQRVRDSRCRQLLEKTDVMINPAIDAMGHEKRDHTVVRWRLTDGRTLEASCTFAKGHPERALTTDEIVNKFHRLADERIGPSRAAAIREATLSMTDRRADDLIDLLAAGQMAAMEPG